MLSFAFLRLKSRWLQQFSVPLAAAATRTPSSLGTIETDADAQRAEDRIMHTRSRTIKVNWMCRAAERRYKSAAHDCCTYFSFGFNELQQHIAKLCI